ncbi:MAG: TonB-dependent receptor [Bryobacteraceae bacterium]|nr:TonB-dependent receptor [Bryobacteraceae bacterium]MDW8378350.1 TonB-dependent receptor [Bryobacterales bacterium]
MLRTVAVLVWGGGALFGAGLRVSVVDAQGGVVANARVVARHAATGREFSCRTSAEGGCDIVAGLKGAYWVRASSETGELEAEATQLQLDEERQTVNLTLRPATLRSAVTVVSGSRQEELQEESPVKVEAITRPQMLTTGYERVSDVLQEIPGVLVRRGSTSTVGGEQIQGIDSRQVLVLQDGLPVVGARGIKAGAINLNRQTSDRLTRIEVAKGAGAALYGSDAIGGVINLITREPSVPFETGVVFSGGTLGQFDGRGDLGGRKGGWSYFLNLGQSRLDSYSLLPNSVTTVGPQVLRHDLLWKTRYTFHPRFSLGFTANAFHNREQGRNLSETGPVQGNSRDSMQTYALVADWLLSATTNLQARAYAARYDESNLTTPIGRPAAPSPSNLNERLKRLDATISQQAGLRHFLQGGVEWAQTLYRGANRLVGDNAGQQVTAVDTWLQDKWTATRRLTFSLGGRVTSHSMFGSAAVPKAGAILKLNDSWIVRGSFGLGFRAPDLGQLYFRFANPASFYQVIGNPNLKPEHSQSFQAGVLFRQRRYRLGMTLYRNQIRDLIESRLVGTPRSTAELNALLAALGIPFFFDPLINRQTFIYFNQSRIFTQGVELDAELNLVRNLRASGAYTFLQAVDRNTRLPLPQRHRHQGQLRVDYLIPKLGLTANVRASFFSHWVLNAVTGTRGLPYQIWDTYVGKDFRRGIQMFLAVDNFNHSRDGKLQLATPSFDRPDYGRMFRLGLRYRFQKRD